LYIDITDLILDHGKCMTNVITHIH